MTKLIHMPKPDRVNFIQSELSRLKSSDTEEPAEIAARLALEAKDRIRRHDEMFADNYVTIPGHALPMSRTLVRMQGYEVGDEARGVGGDD